MAGRWLKVAPLMVAIAVAAAACGSSGTSPRASTAPASPAQGAPTSAAPMGAPTAVLYRKNLRFNPATIHVTPGQKVTVQVVNDDTVAHTFTIPGIVDTGSVSPGQSKTVTFTDDLRRPAVLPAAARPQAPAPARLRPRPDAMRFTFGVPFVLVECETCHQERPAEAPCPHCASRTLYDDPELDRRRAMVAEVRPVLDERPRPVVLDAGEVFTALGTWIDAFLRALQEAAMGPRGGNSQRSWAGSETSRPAWTWRLAQPARNGSGRRSTESWWCCGASPTPTWARWTRPLMKRSGDGPGTAAPGWGRRDRTVARGRGGEG